MKIKDFIEKVEDLYLGTSMETQVNCNGFIVYPHWIGSERYTFKDENGNDIILKRIDETTYYTDFVHYNVMACFELLNIDRISSYYNSLSNMMEYLKKSLDNGEITEEDELYIMLGQTMEENSLYEIEDIDYESDRMGDYLMISTKGIPIKNAIPNIKSSESRKKFLEELNKE